MSAPTRWPLHPPSTSLVSSAATSAELASLSREGLVGLKAGCLYRYGVGVVPGQRDSLTSVSRLRRTANRTHRSGDKLMSLTNGKQPLRALGDGAIERPGRARVAVPLHGTVNLGCGPIKPLA